MGILRVFDGTGYRPVSGVPGGISLPSADPEAVPRSVGDLAGGGDAITGWDDGWQYPTLLNGWKNYMNTPTHARARYRRYPGGHCILQGLVTGGSSAGAVILTLGVGYRPARRTIHSAIGGSNTARMDIYPNGNVAMIASGSTSWQGIHAEWFASDWEFA